MRKLGACLALVALTTGLLAGCSWSSAENGDGTERHGPSALQVGQSTVPVIELDGSAYVDIGKMAGLIGFQTAWSADNSTYRIGDHDVIWSFQVDSATAVKEEQQVQMDGPARKHEASLAIPSSAVKRLFGDEAVFTVDETQVAIFPAPDYADPAQAGGEDFGDDPLDPAVQPAEGAQEANRAQQAGKQGAEKTREPGGGTGPTAGLQASQAEDGLKMLAAEGQEVVASAKKFLGVPYEFGADPYAQSKRFDCSSFVRNIFRRYGLEMPRTARAQAKKGEYVSRSELRVGDLLYFYVPGRFKSDQKVGHVGIYMGNRRMIHASPLPEDGVQVTDIDKAYWKKTFLYAKRVL
ncbi:C40 family peptidase [Paenibacillus sp. IB182496]|uniref:C40 family peptidase n=1 Tax=Paenibacillus sabuli TaxID=2772509 RepID=A0A927BWN9_9BACL|nr:C40 family peptidase [Paenibacillus sabuli]MBD2848248.1 C40 family peptidase [Paenibacillus sabuli]